MLLVGSHLYRDASALVKRYIAEAGSGDVKAWIAGASSVATSLISRTEVAAAITRTQRLEIITSKQALTALQLFRNEWEIFQRLPVNELIVIRGDALACEFGLRGYDAVHLATALLWQETLGLKVRLATFDGQLIGAGTKVGLSVLPEN